MLPFRDFLKTGCLGYTVLMRLPIMPQLNPAKPAFFIPSLDIGPPPLNCLRYLTLSSIVAASMLFCLRYGGYSITVIMLLLVVIMVGSFLVA